MFNWLGNHKIGILGASNSGKTILLTSLLWHLENHSPKWFDIIIPRLFKKDTGGKKVESFKLLKEVGDHRFCYTQHKNTLLMDHCWPEKTMDYAIAECTYSISGTIADRHVVFVDIPGERISDILIWKAKNYRDWVGKIYKFWDCNPENKRVMALYRDSADNVESTLEQLTETYKRSMWGMLERFCQITPSTYYLGTDGSMLGDSNNDDKETAILERHIWGDRDLIPIPEPWCKAHPEESRQFEKIFVAYRKQVLKPLFNEVDDCDNFIFCIDIPGILNNGPTCLMNTQQTFKDFIGVLAPSKFTRIMNFIGRNYPRLAYVATKSDMVWDKDALEMLLEDFIGPFNFAGIQKKCFVCSACESSEEKSRNGENILVGTDCDNRQKLITLPKKLPAEWPAKWDPTEYDFPEIAPKLYAFRPPKQYNLNEVYNFVVEGKE